MPNQVENFAKYKNYPQDFKFSNVANFRQI